MKKILVGIALFGQSLFASVDDVFTQDYADELLLYVLASQMDQAMMYYDYTMDAQDYKYYLSVMSEALSFIQQYAYAIDASVLDTLNPLYDIASTLGTLVLPEIQGGNEELVNFFNFTRATLTDILKSINETEISPEIIVEVGDVVVNLEDLPTLTVDQSGVISAVQDVKNELHTDYTDFIDRFLTFQNWYDQYNSCNIALSPDYYSWSTSSLLTLHGRTLTKYSSPELSQNNYFDNVIRLLASMLNNEIQINSSGIKTVHTLDLLDNDLNYFASDFLDFASEQLEILRKFDLWLDEQKEDKLKAKQEEDEILVDLNSTQTPQLPDTDAEFSFFDTTRVFGIYRSILPSYNTMPSELVLPTPRLAMTLNGKSYTFLDDSTSQHLPIGVLSDVVQLIHDLVRVFYWGLSCVVLWFFFRITRWIYDRIITWTFGTTQAS